MSNIDFNALGFYDFFDVSGRLSVADLYKKSNGRCGIYLLEFSDGLYYIGQAVDVVRRFSQHRKNYDNIARMSFQHIHQKALNEREQYLIHESERIGIPLMNRVFMSNVLGDTDLDGVLSEEEQNNWLTNPYLFRDETVRISDTNNPNHRLRYQHNFEKLQQHENFKELLDLLRWYITETIPACRRTEFTFWGVSCLPSTNKNTYPRLFCVNINLMETFVVYYSKNNPDQIAAFINLAKTPFRNKYRFNYSFQLRYPRTFFGGRTYSSGGTDQMQIQIGRFAQIEKVLRDPAVVEAARTFNLRLMRKGPNLNAGAHSFALTDLVYSQS